MSPRCRNSGIDESDSFVDKILSKYPDHKDALSLKNEIRLGRKGESMQDLVEKRLKDDGAIFD